MSARLAAVRPFEQIPFGDVPDRPKKPHAFFDARLERVRFRSGGFGEVEAAVRIAGSGPPLLLVHGLMTSSYSFRYVLAPLAERFTVYMPDLVGSGRSSKPDAAYFPDEVARWIGDLMRALGIEGSRVVGNSMGGYLTMRLCLLEPKSISRLVNLHSPGLATARMHALAVLFRLLPRPEKVLELLVSRDPEKWVHRNVHYFDESLKSREEHREYAAPLRTTEGVRAFARTLSQTLAPSEMKRFASTLESARFPVPLQLVYAAKDPMVPPSVGDRLRTLVPEAEFVRLENASHFAHVDAPDAFLASAVPFLERD